MWPFKKTPSASEIVSTNIGEVLKKLGAVSDDDLREAVAEQRDAQVLAASQKLLGQILVRRGAITQKDLDVALDVQKKLRTAPRVEGVLALAEGQTTYARSLVEGGRQMMDSAPSVLALAKVGSKR